VAIHLYTLNLGEKLLEDIRFSQTMFPNLRQKMKYILFHFIGKINQNGFLHCWIKNKPD
jgi:hypothetical protein